MLSNFTVQNIALIDKLELELGNGLNILSGETGAGKSIIIDALNFVLGERADRSLIRFCADYASVEAVFRDYFTQAISSYLNENGIDAEEVLILRRKMTPEGKNECRINGKLVTLSILKGLTELLVDIHGQHEHQSLLRVSTHIDLLDSMNEETISSLKAEVAAAHTNYTSLKKEMRSLGNSEERAVKLDVLSYQIAEIEKANIEDGEEDELLEKRRRVRNSEKILSALSGAKSTLDGYDNTAVTAQIKSASAILSTVRDFNTKLLDIVDRLDTAKTEIADISYTLNDMLSQLDFDNRSANQIEERLETVRTLQRKYGGNYDSLQVFYAKAKSEFDLLSNAADRVEQLEKLLKTSAATLTSCAEKLTVERKNTAQKFEKSLIKELVDLGMSGSTFKVEIATVNDVDLISSNGADSVEFLISPNKGEPLKPLAKIISGGEMSRFMLALKNIVANIDGIGTMVFDEIDTGISGHIAAVVAEKLCNISRKRQVIAVTHQPALAAMSDHHFLIEKSEKDGKTLTHLNLLEDNTSEIARLIGGNDYSDYAYPHAKEMKFWAQRYKETLQKN